MKKRFFASLMLVFMILPVFFVRAEGNYDETKYRFNDYTESLSEDEFNSLNNKIDENKESLRSDFPIFLLDTYDYDGELLEYSKIVYENNKFGYGEKKDGIFLVVDAENSRFGIYFYGNTEKNIPKNKQNELWNTTKEMLDSEELSYYVIFDRYLDNAFAMSKEWNVEKADKADGMPYWYVDDVYAFENYHAENPPRVVDNAGILTEEQKAELTAQVERICNTYDYSYVIFTDDDSHGLSKDVYGADFIYYGGYGKGDDFSAVCFFLCLQEGNRGWRTISTNSYEEVYTSDVTYTIDEIVDGDMRSGRYYEALKKQADYIERSLADGNFEIIEPPKPKKTNFFGWPLIVGIIIAFVIAEMVITDMKNKMKLHTAVSANEYLVKDSLNIRNKSSNFLYFTLTKTKRKESSSGGGSSYSSGHASSGGSYSSGGRDF